MSEILASASGVDPEEPVASGCFGETYFAVAISASTAAGKPLGNGTSDAA